MANNAWAGGVTDASFRVVSTGDIDSWLEVDVDPQFSSPETYAVQTPGPGQEMHHRAVGLDSDTRYYWRVADDGPEQLLSGRVSTFGITGEPYSFVFGHATCAGGKATYPGPASTLRPNEVSDHPVFDDIRGFDELAFFAHGGDLHYYNIGGSSAGHSTPLPATVATYRTSYDDVLSTSQGSLYRHTPIQYVWDDHDFGPNDSNRYNPGREEAGQVYRERVPHYPLAEPGGADDQRAIYHSFQIGRILWIASDLRYHRDPNGTIGGSLLGPAQAAWMEEVLRTSSAEFMIWQNSQPIMSRGVMNGWGVFPDKRDALIQMFGDTGWLDRMMSITGDRHDSAIEKGPGNLHGGFPCHLASPLDSGPGRGLTWATGGYRGEHRGQWGKVAIRDLGPSITVELQGMYHV